MCKVISGGQETVDLASRTLFPISEGMNNQEIDSGLSFWGQGGGQDFTNNPRDKLSFSFLHYSAQNILNYFHII